MNKKINKSRSEDLFAGLKRVDQMLDEAAGIKSTPALSFDERLKKRLTEGLVGESSSADISMEEEHTPEAFGEGETTKLESEMQMESEMNEYNYTGDNYQYGYDGKTNQFGEESMFESDSETGEDKTKEFYDKSLEEGDGTGEDKTKEFYDKSLEEEDADLLEMLLEDDENLAVEDPTSGANTGDLAGGPEMGAEAGVDGTTDPLAGDDMSSEDPLAGGDDSGLDAGAGDMSAIGGDAGMSPMGGVSDMGGDPTADAGATPAVDATIDIATQPEDIDALIDGLLLENQELKDLGYEDLGDDEITAKVKGTGKGPKVQLDTTPSAETTESALQENDTPKSTKLGDDDITGNVKGAGDTNKSGSPEAANKDLKFVDAKDKDFASNKVKDEKATTLNQPNFDKVKKESEMKGKALTHLATKYARLEDEIKALKLENYKAKKVNAILTLCELKQSTREALVTSFNEAKDFAAVNKLYKDVAGFIKESKRPSLNEAISKANKGIKNIVSESTDNSSIESTEQARKDLLMGFGNEDFYNKY